MHGLSGLKADRRNQSQVHRLTARLRYEITSSPFRIFALTQIGTQGENGTGRAPLHNPSRTCSAGLARREPARTFRAGLGRRRVKARGHDRSLQARAGRAPLYDPGARWTCAAHRPTSIERPFTDAPPSHFRLTRVLSRPARAPRAARSTAPAAPAGSTTGDAGENAS